MNETKLSLAVILGDGVGHDILPVVTEVMKEAALADEVQVDPTVYNYGALRYLDEGLSLIHI